MVIIPAKAWNWHWALEDTPGILRTNHVFRPLGLLQNGSPSPGPFSLAIKASGRGGDLYGRPTLAQEPKIKDLTFTPFDKNVLMHTLANDKTFSLLGMAEVEGEKVWMLFLGSKLSRLVAKFPGREFDFLYLTYDIEAMSFSADDPGFGVDWEPEPEPNRIVQGNLGDTRVQKDGESVPFTEMIFTLTQNLKRTYNAETGETSNISVINRAGEVIWKALQDTDIHEQEFDDSVDGTIFRLSCFIRDPPNELVVTADDSPGWAMFFEGCQYSDYTSRFTDNREKATNLTRQWKSYPTSISYATIDNGPPISPPPIIQPPAQQEPPVGAQSGPGIVQFSEGFEQASQPGNDEEQFSEGFDS